MNKKIIMFAVSAAVLTLLSVGVVYAQETAEDAVSNTEQQQAEAWKNMPGGKQGGFGGQRPNRENMQMPEGMAFPEGMPTFENGEFAPPENPGNFDFQQPGGNLADDGQDSQEQVDKADDLEQKETQDNTNYKEQSSEQEGQDNRQNKFGGQRPMENWGNMQNNEHLDVESNAAVEQKAADTFNLKNVLNEYQTPIISVVLLLFAFVFVKLYKRKNY